MIRRVDAPAAERLNALAALHAAAFAPERGWSAEEIADLAATGALIAEDADRGFALISLAADEAELLTIAVAEEARGAGIGAALLNAAEGVAAKNGATRIFLEVAADNAAALALYRKSGFEEIGRRPAYYSRPEGRIDALMLAKAL
ncbi:MAG: ribosomal protein S18-alanine N-acetyltransferase [Pseudomonadota bacterium]